MTKPAKRKSASPLDHEPPYTQAELIELTRLAREDAIGPDGRLLGEPNADGEILIEGRADEALQRLQQHYEWVDQHGGDDQRI